MTPEDAVQQERSRCLELVRFHFWEAFINPAKGLDKLQEGIVKAIQEDKK